MSDTTCAQTNAVAVQPRKRCVRSNLSWATDLTFGNAKVTMPMSKKRIQYDKTKVRSEVYKQRCQDSLYIEG